MASEDGYGFYTEDVNYEAPVSLSIDTVISMKLSDLDSFSLT